jgi:hypothetical protein
MIPQSPTDAEAFYGFLGEQLAGGGRDMPPEECCALGARKATRSMPQL